MIRRVKFRPSIGCHGHTERRRRRHDGHFSGGARGGCAIDEHDQHERRRTTAGKMSLKYLRLDCVVVAPSRSGRHRRCTANKQKKGTAVQPSSMSRRSVLLWRERLYSGMFFKIGANLWLEGSLTSLNSKRASIGGWIMVPVTQTAARAVT